MRTSFPNLSWLLTLKCLTEASINAFCPLGTTLTKVFAVEYPIPALTITTSVSLPSETTALNLPPIPSPVILRSGADVYSEPGLIICVLLIRPFETIT